MCLRGKLPFGLKPKPKHQRSLGVGRSGCSFPVTSQAEDPSGCSSLSSRAVVLCLVVDLFSSCDDPSS